MEIQPPSFSLGFDDDGQPPFSLGIDSQPPTPAAATGRLEEVLHSTFVEETPIRAFKRLRRGPASECQENLDEVDDIEVFSSDEELSTKKTQGRGFSVLKTSKTPPVFERNAPNAEVSRKKTCLGTNIAGASSNLIYEFRDNTICATDNGEASLNNDTAALLRKRFPHFNFVDDFQETSTSEPVYIDYRGQFTGKSAAGSSNNVTPTNTQNTTARKRKRATKRRKETGSSSKANGGYWVTAGSRKVYVSGGQKLSGRTAYVQYQKDTGKKPRRKKRK